MASCRPPPTLLKELPSQRHPSEQGREEGRQVSEREGLRKGELIGKVQMVQELLDETPSTTDQLAALEIDELQAQLTALQQRLRERPA
ncbi:MAG: hypothetical protein Aurels2KO_10900 [Aureliella sp.]